MTQRFQFSLRTLFRWTTSSALTLGAFVSATRLASDGPLSSDSAIALLYLALAVALGAASIGAMLDDSVTRGVLVGAGFGLALVTLLVLSSSQRP